MATFARLKDGSWGLRVEAEEAPSQGSFVQVTKKSGVQVTLQVGRVLWSGSGIHLCSIGSGEVAQEPQQAPQQASGRRQREMVW